VQAEYTARLDALPDAFRESATGEALQAFVELDFEEICAIEPPRGFGIEHAPLYLGARRCPISRLRPRLLKEILEPHHPRTMIDLQNWMHTTRERLFRSSSMRLAIAIIDQL
jgi:hypothetical protein